MVHPDDRNQVIKDCSEAMNKESVSIGPYRIFTKNNDYIYVCEQTRKSNMHGAESWQSIVIDVNELIKKYQKGVLKLK